VIIRDAVWKRIREQFSAAEKAALNKTVTGEGLWPRGIVIDESRLAPELREKIMRLASPPRAPRKVRA
jgi:hypothetical protein